MYHNHQIKLLALKAAIEIKREGSNIRRLIIREIDNLHLELESIYKETSSHVSFISEETKRLGTHNNWNILPSSNNLSCVDNINYKIKKIIILTGKVNEIMDCSVTNSIFKSVKLDHLVWKNKLYQKILKNTDNSVDILLDHKSCRMGIWLYIDERSKKYRQLPNFINLEFSHIDIHKYGFRAICSIN